MKCITESKANCRWRVYVANADLLDPKVRRLYICRKKDLNMLIEEESSPYHDLIYYLLEKDDEELDQLFFKFIHNGAIRRFISGFNNLDKARELAYFLCNIKLKCIDNELEELVDDAVQKVEEHRIRYEEEEKRLEEVYRRLHG